MFSTPLPPMTRFRRKLDKTWPDLSRLAFGRAPGFIYGRAVDHIPVFCYHAVDATFERDLEHLARGGYRTVGTHELEQHLSGERETDGRAVALTFDDGDISLQRVAVPLLRKYGFKGIAFIVAGITQERSNELLVGWSELRAAVDEGVLEVGPHSMWHHRVPISPRAHAFVTPQTDCRVEAEIPVPRYDGSEPIRMGAPFFVAAPSYLARRAFVPDPEAVDAAIERVVEEGEGFLANPKAQRELERRLARSGRYESPDEADMRVIADMQESIAVIQREVPNPAERHLCYPWYAGDERTDRLAHVAGATAVHLGVDRRSRAAEPERPHRIGRYPDAWLRSLPGERRRAFTTLMRWRIGGLLGATE